MTESLLFLDYRDSVTSITPESVCWTANIRSFGRNLSDEKCIFSFALQPPLDAKKHVRRRRRPSTSARAVGETGAEAFPAKLGERESVTRSATERRGGAFGMIELPPVQ